MDGMLLYEGMNGGNQVKETRHIFFSVESILHDFVYIIFHGLLKFFSLPGFALFPWFETPSLHRKP
jgi:hypothetical protein